MFQPTKPAQAFQDRKTYIPPHIESAMAEHAQRTMPAHLKKYNGSNTYIPEHARDEIAEHLENSLPAHMKQYAGAYMQQNVVQPSLKRQSLAATPEQPSVSGTPPVQPNVPRPGTPFTGQPQTSYAPTPADQAQNPSPDQPYDFITSPQQQPKEPLLASIPGGSSMGVRIGLIAGGLVVLLIIFTVLRGLLSSSPDLASFVTIAQEQQELIHLTTNAGQQTSLSAANQNLAATVLASVTTSQGQTIKYLTTNHKKVSVTQLNLKVSAAADAQLSDAAAAGTYNQAFDDIMQTQLNGYGNTLALTYKQNHGPVGQALLKDSYRQLQLFQTQLGTPAN